jgi:hexosaminidase
MNRSVAAAILLLPALAGAGVHAAEPAIVPRPASIVAHEGAFRVSPATPIVAAPSGDGEAWTAAKILRERLQASRGLSLAVSRGAPREGAIVLEREAGEATPGDESYRLEVTPRRIAIRARSLAGLDHGASTLWQLAGTGATRAFSIASVEVDDAPRFRWRGLLLDSARHYQSPGFILRFIDAMAAQKLNVLHWHLTDDQGWRIEIRKYPRLTSVGAWRVPAGAAAQADIDAKTGKPRLYGGYYTQETARRIVAYAAARGVTIVPEIEMPGHASAVLAAYPRFAASDHPPRVVPSDWGVYANVLNLEPETLAFLEDVLTEVMALFPAPYIHVGGDEVETTQWRDSPRVQRRMRELGIRDVGEIQHWLTRRIAGFLHEHGRRLVGWDEIVEPELPRDAVVMSWRGEAGAIAAAAHGNDSVLAVDPTLYFDHRQTASPEEPPGRAAVVSLADVYRFQPLPSALDASQRAHVLGLQGNLWTEHIRTGERLAWMAFPRAAAIAELGWTPEARLDWEDFRARVAALPALYRALGVGYAKTVFGPPPAPPTGTVRTSDQLDLCDAPKVALSLEDDAPVRGARAKFLVDILDPCWIYRRADLDGVSAIEVRVGQVPFNFQVGDAAARVRFPEARTAQGELVVRRDTCEGEEIARIPLAPALRSFGVTALPAARVPAQSGEHDLCLRFAQRGLDPLWVIGSVRLVGHAR